MGRVLSTTFFPIMVMGAVLGACLSLLLGRDAMTFIGVTILVTISFFLLWFIMVRDKLLYYMRGIIEKKRGKWFGIFKCGCEEWIKALDTMETRKCKDNEKGLIAACYGCNMKNKMMETKNHGKSGDAICTACESTGENVETCLSCKKPVKIVKMWRIYPTPGATRKPGDASHRHSGRAFINRDRHARNATR
jgi:hypothetical protein